MPISKTCDLTAFFLKKLLVNVSHRDKETNQERKAGSLQNGQRAGAQDSPGGQGPGTAGSRELGHGPQASPSR